MQDIYSYNQGNTLTLHSRERAFDFSQDSGVNETDIIVLSTSPSANASLYYEI